MPNPFPSEPLVDSLLKAKAQAIQEKRSLNRDEMIRIVDACLDELWKKVPPHKRRPSPPKIGTKIEEAWLDELQASPANRGIDVRGELARMRLWASNNAGMQPTRKRFINWLLKVDRPVSMHSPGRPVFRKMEEPVGWKEFVNETYPDSIYAKGGECEHYPWDRLPADYQAKFLKEMGP